MQHIEHAVETTVRKYFDDIASDIDTVGIDAATPQAVEPDDMAAILFTSGSTGAPKGVVYRHRHFNAQVAMLRRAFGIEAGEVSLPTFPPFALFDPALGMTTVVPEMDPTRPAEADPEVLVETIERFGVTNIFGSPALLDTLSRHCVARSIRMESVRRVISAGAAVPVRTVRRMQDSLYTDAVIHTPYGATECLPVSSINSTEIDDRMVDRIESGDGVCVGRPIEPNEVRIVRISEMPFAHLSETTEMPRGMPGEIIVTGPTCTDAYWRRDTDTAMAKLKDDEGNDKDLPAMENLGLSPLPDGMVRLYSQYANKDLACVGGTSTKYVPIGDRVEVAAQAPAESAPHLVMLPVAPGDMILGAVSATAPGGTTNGYVLTWCGTSFASPLVAGIAGALTQ